MAMVDYPIQHFAKLQDRGGNKFDMRWHSTGTVQTAAWDLYNNWLPALQALTQCKVIEAGYVVKQAEQDQTPLPTNGEGEKKAMISCALVTETPPNPGQTKFAQILIPAPVDGLFLATAGEGANIVDVENSELLAFLESFTVGAGLLPSLTLSDFQTIKDPTIAGNISGKRVTRGSTRG